LTWEPYRQSPAGTDFDPLTMGAQAAVIFDDLEREMHRSVDYVALFGFRSSRRLDSYWLYRADSVGVPVRVGACADGRPGWDRWRHGELVCYVTRAGSAALRWTDQRTSTYGVMNARPGRKSVAMLYRQWLALPGIGDPPA
jgi:hypothetical protein